MYNLVVLKKLFQNEYWSLLMIHICVPFFHQVYAYTYSALRASCTHGLIAQSIRASERNSVVVGSNSTQANFL